MPMIHALFDLTVNGGWNGCAVTVYSAIAAIILTAFLERKKP